MNWNVISVFPRRCRWLFLKHHVPCASVHSALQLTDLLLLNNDCCRDCRRWLHSCCSGLACFQFTLPTPQQRLVDAQVPGDLARRVTLDRHQTHRLGLELIRECPSRILAIHHLRSDHTELAEVSARAGEDQSAPDVYKQTLSTAEIGVSI